MGWAAVKCCLWDSRELTAAVVTAQDEVNSISQRQLDSVDDKLKRGGTLRWEAGVYGGLGKWKGGVGSIRDENVLY